MRLFQSKSKLLTPDWQYLVSSLELAAAIAWERPPSRWVASQAWHAKIVSDHYHAVLASGNLDIDDIDAELFDLDYNLYLWGNEK